MKHFCLSILLFLVFLSGCNHSSSTVAENKKNGAVAETTDSAALTVVQLLEVADKNVDKEVLIKGTVTHTCKHSGKRCFIQDGEAKQSVRVEAKGNIGGFNKELVGTDIIVKGILREHKLDIQHIDELEKKTLATQIEGVGSEQSCKEELANIKEMRDWMKSHNKNYYSVYYIDGQDFSELE